MNQGQEKVFYYGISLFTLTIATTFIWGSAQTLLMVAGATALFLVFFWWQYRRWFVVQAMQLLLIGILGVVITDYHVHQNQHNDLDRYVGQEVTLRGVVNHEADIRDFNTRLAVYVKEFDTQVLIKVPFYPAYNYGDQVLITGTLQVPKGFEGDTGRYFDYQNFLLKDGIRYIVNYPITVLVAREQGNPIKQALFDIKQVFIDQLRRILPEPHVSLMGGLLVGAKTAMGQDLLDDFRDTGVIHIVVLSGFNITIIIAFVMAMLGWLGQRTAALVGTLGIVCFVIMTGAGATVVRAALMAFLVIFARVTGNYATALRMLLIVGFVMLLWNPMLLLYDPSFQLSFMATLGLIMLSPYVERCLTTIPNPPYAPLRELLAATLATQIMVTPLLLWMMGTFPTYSPITNFLILATVPWVMLTGFVAGVLSYVSYGIAFIFITLTYIILSYELWIVDLFAHLPWAAFHIPPFGFEWVVIVYVLYAVGGYALYTHKNNKRNYFDTKL